MPSNSDLDNANDMSSELKKLLETYSAIHTEALRVYRPLVRSVINGAITEKQDIERIFDGLINFCGEPEFVELLKELGRYMYRKEPAMVAEYILLYKEIYDSDEEDDNQ